MGYTCDFCGNQRSMVHCRSDAACLCLSCDQHVHGANTLAKRHCRTLLCERCNEQPAFIRCVEERISLCHNCDRMEQACSTSTSTHKRQTINSYSGCPTAAELSTIWSFFTDIPSVDDSNYEHGLDIMGIRKDSDENGLPPPENNCKEDGAPAVELNDEQNAIKSSVWTGSCSMSQPNCVPDSVDQMAGFQHSDLHKLSWPGTKGLGPCEDDVLFEDFNIDEVDLDIENYEEIFGVALSHSELLLENGGINSLFGATANSTCQGAVAAQEASDGMVNAMQPACSNVASADSMVNSKMDPIHSHCFKTRPTHSALSFSGLTGESSAGDYQDCGASSMLLMGEPPWCPPCPESSFSSASRNSAVMRYQEKKKARKFEKKVRYASRKARADVRKRVKGRFVKAGDAYDYDPLTKPEAAEISVFNNN